MAAPLRSSRRRLRQQTGGATRQEPTREGGKEEGDEQLTLECSGTIGFDGEEEEEAVTLRPVAALGTTTRRH